jgi:DNA-binding CsgD family transcriptional regulator
MTENQIVRQLHGIAGKLTADPDLHMDLMQEMFVHLVQTQTAEPGQELSWYLKSCEFHARTCLKPGRKIESSKHDRNNVPREEVPVAGNGESGGNGTAHSPATVAIEIQGELITNETANRIIPRLSEMQQQILFLLMKGCGVRETGREVGITHPAVIKHRKKIARIAHELLQESAGAAVAGRNGANGNGNGEGHAA